MDAGLGRILDQAWTLFLRAAAAAAVIAAADYAWNRYRTAKELRMSKTDVRREHKDSEGDPLLRARGGAGRRSCRATACSATSRTLTSWSPTPRTWPSRCATPTASPRRG